MRLKFLFPCLTVALLAAAGMTIWSGCDVGSATEQIKIDPSDVTLSRGQSQVFTVSGGYEYTWSLSDNVSGSLNTRQGDTVTFTLLNDTSTGTSNTSAGNITISCTSFIPGTPQGSTNSPSSGYSETATALVHILNALALSPGSATIAAGASMGLVASGGSGSYVWSVSGFGSLSATSGGSVTFVAGSAAGTATITVTDSDGLTASCTVTISGSLSTLTLSPTSATISVLHTKALAATGGSGTYSWSVSVSGSGVAGSLDSSSGSPVIYTAPSSATVNIITVSDGSSSVQCTMTVTNP